MDADEKKIVERVRGFIFAGEIDLYDAIDVVDMIFEKKRREGEVAGGLYYI